MQQITSMDTINTTDANGEQEVLSPPEDLISRNVFCGFVLIFAVFWVVSFVFSSSLFNLAMVMSCSPFCWDNLFANCQLASKEHVIVNDMILIVFISKGKKKTIKI